MKKVSAFSYPRKVLFFRSDALCRRGRRAPSSLFLTKLSLSPSTPKARRKKHSFKSLRSLSTRCDERAQQTAGDDGVSGDSQKGSEPRSVGRSAASEFGFFHLMFFHFVFLLSLNSHPPQKAPPTPP